MRALAAVLLALAPWAAHAQDPWDWGWSPPDTSWAEDALLHHIDLPERSVGEAAIGFYQADVVPRMARPCPSWPSCSMYTRYAVARWGLVAGTLMGIDRIFFRENAAFMDGQTAFTFRLDDRLRVYDPPDANVARLLRDWRQLHPDYRARFHSPRADSAGLGGGGHVHGGARRGVHVPAR